jgi:hypothetical protein
VVGLHRGFSQLWQQVTLYSTLQLEVTQFIKKFAQPRLDHAAMLLDALQRVLSEQLLEQN